MSDFDRRLADPLHVPEPVAPTTTSRTRWEPFALGIALVVLGVVLVAAAASQRPEEPSTVDPTSASGWMGQGVALPAAPASQRGWATWCAETATQCQGWDDRYVGAVPSFSYGDEPYMVQVCRVDDPLRCTHVLVVSFCACGDRRGIPTVIDLSPPAFRELAPLSSGIVLVTVDRGAAPATLPPTDRDSWPEGTEYQPHPRRPAR